MAGRSFTDAVRERLGDVGWLDRSEIDAALVDFRGVFTGEAIGMARPSSTAEVSDVVRLAVEHDVAIVTQGGNTGLSGGAVPAAPTANDDRPRVILSLTRMREIEDVNVDRGTITAQAGVTIEALQQRAADVGRLFAPDWGARGSATLGGAVSTNAGGINVVKHGNMREHVLGLEVVMADGRVWDGLRSLPKDNSGFDLKQLFISGEGTIGIVTRAVVTIHPRPAAQRVAFASLRSLDALNDLMTLARTSTPGALSAIELIPEVGVAQVVERFGVQRPLESIAEWYVLVRYDSAGEPVDPGDDLTSLLTDAMSCDLISDGVVASTPAQEANLWLMRDELTATRSFGGFGVKYDLAIPPDRIAEFLRAAEALVDTIVDDALSFAFGHVGDGNLHFTVLTPDRDDGPLEAAAPVLRAALDGLVWEFDGTISAEHGLGRELRDRIVGQKSEVELDLMRSIKHALDPDDRLNPGVMLPSAPLPGAHHS
ncbi:MAG: FAD-binding oxidoreductase [Ilumatobacter sp.]|uniref:FAD-binding oxidoreductase n=1 Tax=Ilumatobacter sp. TaxID=1967498 RepID=UPI0032977E44